MKSAQFVESGQLEEGLSALQEEIRNNPQDSRLRVFLFQLNCVLGRWDKALTQLQVLASLEAENMLLAQIFRPIIACELLRQDVFAGKRTPLVFGEPTEWLGELVQCNALVAQGEFAAAAQLRSHAFDAAPASSGAVDGDAFVWLADADSRLGPVLEVILEGKYYWAPLNRLRRLEIPKPTDLRDLVWTPALLTWANGTTMSGHIPSRYSGTESCADSALRLARKTEWLEKPEDTYLGLGQRILATDKAEYPLLECRTIELTPPA
jgi:type VI secretion system protein ImpE